MANRFWNFVTTLVPGHLAKAEDVNTNLSGVQTGFDDVGTELDQCLQVTSSPGTMTISLNAAARAGKVVAFDTNGDIIASTDLGDWKGDHADAAGTDYAERDLVKDAAGALKLDSIYRCNTSHTSTGSLAADIANWDLVIDMTDVKISEAAASASASAALTSETNAAASAAAAAASAATLLNTKVIDIGDWDMDTDSTVALAHGLTFAKIRNVEAAIRNDANSRYYNIFNATGTNSGRLSIGAANVDLFRAAGDFFDSVDFNATPYNRGWITIQYTD